MTLANKIKARALNQQQDFIIKELENIEQNGNVAKIYMGEIFYEVKSYLKEQGFKIQKCDNEILVAKAGGLPVYLITIDENRSELSKTKTKLGTVTNDDFFEVIKINPDKFK